jgi:hypothetical protein
VSASSRASSMAAIARGWMVERALFATMVGVVLTTAYVTFRFADQPILEAHGFRQTQTALTAYWLDRNGLSLDYQTPVAGAPWAIPYELPIYQALAAAASRLTGLPLTNAGRIVSWLFLVAGVPFVFSTASKLRLPRSTALIVASLWLSSPLYAFWGRSFMIETAALFFTLGALPFAIDLIDGATDTRSVAGATSFFVLAALQKVTTWAPTFVVVGLCWLMAEWRRRRAGSRPAASLVAPMVAFGVPVVVAAAWTKHAESVRSLNAFGAQMSSDALRFWTFGDSAQRFSSALYVDVIWNRLFRETLGGVPGLVLIAAALAFRADPRIRALLLLSMGTLLLHLFTFTNLHIVHAYYQMSCGFFGSAALGIAIGGWLPRNAKHELAAPAAALLVVATNFAHFRNDYWAILTKPFPVLQTRTLFLAEALKRYTAPESAFVAFGYDWNSELAFYAERRSFTVPDWFWQHERAWRSPESYVGRARVGAIVACPSQGGPSRDDVVRRYLSERRWSYLEIDGCQMLIPVNERAPGAH